MSGAIPRRRSMTDALLDDPAAMADRVRNELLNAVEEVGRNDYRLDKFAKTLPKLSESDLAALEQSDSTCPICLTSLLAILAEEETAIAMDSPAHPLENLGVTRLVQTCGHIFCRKDIRGWISERNNTCPTCRTPFIVLGPLTESDLAAAWLDVPVIRREALINQIIAPPQMISGGGFRIWQMPGDLNSPIHASEPISQDSQLTEDARQESESSRNERDDDRSESFSGMYS